MALATRQIIMFRRLFKHRWCYVVLFAVVFIFFVFTRDSWQSHVSNVHSNRDRVRADRMARRQQVDLEANAQIDEPKLNNDGDAGILIKPDTKTVFRDGTPSAYEVGDNGDSKGPGAGGHAVNVDRNDRKVQTAFNDFGFNTHVSDMISLNRTIPDTRSPECKYWHYPPPTELPTASVIIAFHNEGWSPLMRTVHSVLLRSPPELLKEVLMVDDASDKPHLGEKLEKYIEQFNGKVRLIRNPERLGLINTRSNGAKHALGDVVIFLDAHCEANVNWLPPLLAPIAADRSPTHAGGLFAIDRKWFEELGYYDDGLLIWGGEQYELSFKIWQCGGGILFIPCSHVGHVYRARMPYSLGKFKGPIIANNLKRVVETWMDEYGEYYYAREPFMRNHDQGDLTKMKTLRKEKQCKSFKWFMTYVAYDVEAKYPVQPPNVVWGEAKNPASDLCLDSMGNAIPGTPGISNCHGYGGNQLFRINTKGQMSFGEWCVTLWSDRLKSDRCEFGHVDGPWTYDKVSKAVKHKAKNHCLTVDSSQRIVRLKPCSASPDQVWEWKEIFV